MCKGKCAHHKHKHKKGDRPCLNAPKDAATVSSLGDGTLSHTVIFWFKKGAPAEKVDELARFYVEKTAGLPGVTNVYVGSPANTKRAEADNSFSLYTIMRFKNAAAQDEWQKHPVHSQLKKEFLGYVERIVVYDALE